MDRHVKEVGSLSYISTDVFNANFFTYTVARGPAPGFLMTGTLTTVTGATSVNCPAGNVLRESGKKLYPDVHSGVNTYMVGVYDIVSGLKGFINPNDPMFTQYNSDRPNFLKDSYYTGDNATKNLGPSVLTLGHITSAGDFTSPGSISAAGQVYSSTVTNLTGGPGTGSSPVLIDMRLGQFFTLTLQATGSPLVGVSGVIDFLPAGLIAGAVVRLMACWTPENSANTRTLTLGRNTSPLIIGANNNVVSLTTSTSATICYMLTFACDGSRLWETARVGPLTYR